MWRTRVSDEKHVDHIRRTVSRMDRWRRPLLVFWIAVLIAYLGLYIATIVIVGQLVLGKNNILIAGFFVGTILGAMLGQLAAKLAHALLTTLNSLRTERLMLRYHDVIAALVEVGPGAEGD